MPTTIRIENVQDDHLFVRFVYRQQPQAFRPILKLSWASSYNTRARAPTYAEKIFVLVLIFLKKVVSFCPVFTDYQ
jgi:hypothetical protein